MSVELNPQGGWDAFSIWNLRARFLLHTATWKFAVTPFPVGTHMEYPLLLSSVVARGWTYAGSPSPTMPIATAFVFAVGLVLLLVSTLALARGTSAGLLAGVVLLASPAFMTQAPSEYADVPLAFFFLAALALIVQGGAHVALAVARRRLCRLCRLDQERRRAAGGRAGRGALRERVALRADGVPLPARSGIFLLGALPGLLLRNLVQSWR